MIVQPIETRRIYMEIVDRVCDLIRQGGFTNGDQLPPEREFADQLGVSRTSLREALTALEIMGLIETKHGHGRFVRLNGGAHILRIGSACLVGEESPFALLAARKMLEPGIAAMAARVRSEEMMLKMGDILDSAEANLDDLFFRSEADRLFHRSIAEATENPVIAAVMAFTCGLMGQKLWRALDYTVEAIFDQLQRYWTQHRAIYEAIKAKDEQGAFCSMLGHLEEVERNMMTQ